MDGEREKERLLALHWVMNPPNDAVTHSIADVMDVYECTMDADRVTENCVDGGQIYYGKMSDPNLENPCFQLTLHRNGKFTHFSRIQQTNASLKEALRKRGLKRVPTYGSAGVNQTQRVHQLLQSWGQDFLSSEMSRRLDLGTCGVSDALCKLSSCFGRFSREIATISLVEKCVMFGGRATRHGLQHWQDKRDLCKQAIEATQERARELKNRFETFEKDVEERLQRITANLETLSATVAARKKLSSTNISLAWVIVTYFAFEVLAGLMDELVELEKELNTRVEEIAEEVEWCILDQGKAERNLRQEKMLRQFFIWVPYVSTALTKDVVNAQKLTQEQKKKMQLLRDHTKECKNFLQRVEESKKKVIQLRSEIEKWLQKKRVCPEEDAAMLESMNRFARSISVV